ncbi:MAG: hypothetical protein Q7T16_06675 [Candidatus Burarchaeum sp.]|nr:hypothetical protein [Candidatus Burarchaeum sp.]MDO8340312.1 hypothetical protein [Candidatus Burarchaeum sp.]
MSFEVSLHEEASKALLALDASVRERIIKRIARMREEPSGRHLQHGVDFFVEEVGQYRIVYRCRENRKLIYFIGKHKDYESWYSSKRK